MKILNQTHIITNPFNEKMFIISLQRELSSALFKELIRDEKAGLKLTITMEVQDDEEEN